MSTVIRATAATATIHSSVQMRAGLLTFRDAMPSDVNAYINYWHHSGEKIKELLGIDRAKLGTPDDSRARFFSMIRVPGTEQANIIITITLNARVIGYTNINRFGVDEGYAHLHTYRSSLRPALKMERSNDGSRSGPGLAAALIGPGMGMYFDLLPVRHLVLQTRTSNHWINRALDLYMPPAETRYITDPPGLGAPGECHIRYVRREDVSWMRIRAEVLGRVDRHFRDSHLPPDLDPANRSH